MTALVMRKNREKKMFNFFDWDKEFNGINENVTME
jgi:hypothetical protein